MNNLFSQIERYQQEENIFTAVFAYILEQDNNALLHKFFDNFIGPEFWSSENEVKLQKRHTERNDKKKKIDQPDVTVETDKSIVFFEHKIGAKIKKGQIERYKNRLRSNYNKDNKCLVLITLKGTWHPEGKNGKVIFKHFYWSEIYDFLNSNIIKRDKNNPIIPEFLKYMKEKKMNIDKMTTIGGLSSLFHFRNLLNRVCDMKGYKLLERNIDAKDNFSDSWYGFKIRFGRNKDSNVIWCGFYFDKPDKLIFEYPKKLTKIKAEKAQLAFVHDGVVYKLYGVEKDLIAEGFYKMKKNEQIEILSEWLGEIMSKLKRLK